MEMNRAQVSVIMPARIDSPEKSAWVAQAIHSVQNQTFPYWEMVIVDDHSTHEVTGAWGDNRIRLVPSNGNGVAQARNQAVRLAQGDAIYPLDADDMIDERTLGTLYAEWIKDRRWLVYTGSLVFGEEIPHIVPVQEYDFDALLDHSLFRVGAMFARSAWERAGGWKDGLDGIEDWEFWLSLGEMGVCGLCVDKPFYWYRRHNGSLSSQTTPEKIALLRALHKESKLMPGCCDKRRRAAPSAPIQPQGQGIEEQQVFPGEKGMVVMEYTGANFGITEWKATTPARYAFGGSRRRGYVDLRDVQDMLSKGVFRVVPDEEAAKA